MAWLNQVCKQCGEPYHYCDTCGFDMSNEDRIRGYCGPDCFELGEGYRPDWYCEDEDEDEDVW